MTISCSRLVDATVSRWYHCISRCVRRAHLLGDEAAPGRKDWIENRLKELDQIFAVFVSGFSLMDNHLHLLLRIDPEVANGWSDSEVVERWFRLFPPRGSDRKRIKVSNTESLCLSFFVHGYVYGVEPHVGRGGWTWYTGSAGWMYRLITESLLGLRIEADKLHFNPRPPKNWPLYKMHYRYRNTFYHISVNAPVTPLLGIGVGNGDGIQSLSIDGVAQSEHFLKLVDDQVHHQVDIQLGD